MEGELSFFELGVEDPALARTFYGGLFGWEFADEGKGSRIDSPNVPGGVHGGDPGAAPYLFFRVDDLDAAIKQVQDLGGEVDDHSSEAEDPDTMARFGRFITCRDDQGSGFGLHEPPRQPGPTEPKRA